MHNNWFCVWLVFVVVFAFNIHFKGLVTWPYPICFISMYHCFLMNPLNLNEWLPPAFSHNTDTIVTICETRPELPGLWLLVGTGMHLLVFFLFFFSGLDVLYIYSKMIFCHIDLQWTEHTTFRSEAPCLNQWATTAFANCLITSEWGKIVISVSLVWVFLNLLISWYFHKQPVSPPERNTLWMRQIRGEDHIRFYSWQPGTRILKTQHWICYWRTCCWTMASFFFHALTVSATVLFECLFHPNCSSLVNDPTLEVFVMPKHVKCLTIFLTITFKVTTFHLLAQKFKCHSTTEYTIHHCVTDLCSLDHITDTWCALHTGQQVTLNLKPHFPNNLLSCELSD